MEYKNILLAEDNKKDAELTLEALDELNIANKVDWVKNGEEVINYLNHEGEFLDRTPELPSVILLDLKMPKVDGIETLKYIKSNNKYKHIPVVMLTSSRQETDLVKSYQLGVNAYVIKPIDIFDFIESIKNLGMFWILTNQIPKNHEK